MRTSWWAAALFALAPACSPAPASNNDGGGLDAAGDGGSPSDGSGGDAADTVTRPDVTADAGPPCDGACLIACEETEPDGPIALAPVPSTLLGTIEPVALAVSAPDLSNNPVYESAELLYRSMDFDKWRRGAAQDRVVRTELGSSAGAVNRRSLSYFVQLSDTQLVDDESPMRLALVESPDTSGGIRPQEGYLGRAISAMNRTLAALERPDRPYDFGVFAGDCADSAQTNELRWFVQLMNGTPGLNMDSGNDDDPVPGPDNDPKDPFDPVGFPAPWYFVPGNHDVEVVGVGLADTNAQARAVGTNSITGTRDYRRRWAEPRHGTVVADAERALLQRADIVRELQGGDAQPGPVGHGFAAGMDVANGANYTADVMPGLVRMIAVDTSDDTGGSSGLIHQPTFQWLESEITAAESAGLLVILASHHPPASIDTRAGEVGTTVADAVPADQIVQMVVSHPAVIAWFVGHEHDVKILPHPGPDAQHPGFWEIQSGSIADFPSQARVVEFVDNGNGTLSIFGTMVDYEPQTCMERRFRRLALMDKLSGWERDHTGTAQDRNVELVIPVPATASAAVQAASATAPTRIESETTLIGQ